MARIRSIHPGFWTEENIVSVSPFARLLFIGLWQQADDGGAFEWKPLKLKMLVFPGDNLSLEELLEELVGVNLIQRYEAGDRPYGAIRNFGKWQRPKKPARQFPMPDDMRRYAETAELKDFLKGSLGASFMSAEPSTSGRKEESLFEPVPHQFGTGSGISQQRKDEGGRMYNNKIDKSILRDAPLFAPSEILEKEIRLPPSSPSSGKESSPRWAMTDHLHRIMVLTGRTKANSASLLSVWIKTLGNDLDAFEHILSTAEAKSQEQELADPVAWVEMACLNVSSDRLHSRHQDKAEGKIVTLPLPLSQLPDARTVLFSHGVQTIRKMTGKADRATRSLIGKWLKETRDDAALLNEIIHTAADTRPSDVVAWMQGAIRNRMGQSLSSKPLSPADQARAESLERLRKKHG